MEFRGIPLWSFALYAQDLPVSPGTVLDKPVKLFNSRRIRRHRGLPHTQADPFLFAYEDQLYIYYEWMGPGGVGKIAAFRTSDLENFEDLGVVLDEPFHLSFPFIFSVADQIFLLPEAHQSGKVTLYRFDSFPTGLVKHRTLLDGPYVDAFLTRKDGLWYLFATSSAGLEIHYSADLENEAFRPHPLNPLVTDPRYRRCGGALLEVDGVPVRIAQDGSRTYGSNISFFAIDRLDPHSYSERMLVENFFKRADFWNAEGAHHLSATQFRGQTVIAADGRHTDFLINKLFARFYRRPTGRGSDS